MPIASPASHRTAAAERSGTRPPLHLRLALCCAVVAWVAHLPTGGLAAEPQARQTVSAFEAAVTASLAQQGDRMGFSLQPCTLRPPFAGSRRSFVGRAFSSREDQAILLLATERETVSRWEEFALPGLEGWLTHGAIRCRGRMLVVAHGRMEQHFRWTGHGFRNAFRRGWDKMEKPVATGRHLPGTLSVPRP